VFVDDATGVLMELLFCESESAFSYFAAMRSYLEQHGKPVALYSDKAGVFRVNKKEAQGGAGVTQFGRALSSLNIDILCANTPAAKGRVERAHLTLQDRLVKELRLRGISDLEAANAFAPEFIADYNRRFVLNIGTPRNCSVSIPLSIARATADDTLGLSLESDSCGAGTSCRISRAMRALLNLTTLLLSCTAAFFRSRGEQAIAELALRQQLATYAQKRSKPRLTRLDRALWVALSRFWPRWKDVLVIVKPDTVVRWHREGFRLYW